MRKVIPFGRRRASADAIRDEACAWLARLDAGATAADQERLSKWLAADPAHVRMLLTVAALWDRMDSLAELRALFPLEQYAEQRAPRRRRRLGFAAVAAAACIAVAGVALLALRAPAPTAVPLGYETMIGEQRTVALADGSTVILNTDTRLEVALAARERDVFLLRGEAHFVVAPDPRRPFRVHTGSEVVEAVGTAFTVHRSGADRIEITVTEGRVNLWRADPLPGAPAPDTAVAAATRAPADAKLVSLVAGDYAAVDPTKSAVDRRQMRPQEIEARLSWRHGMLLFDGDALQDVLREIGRYTTTRIDADPAIRDIAVVGYFRAGDVEGLQAAMRDNFGIETRRIGDRHILLTPQQSP
jgi:transmembrane sensor